MTTGQELLDQISKQQSPEQYRQEHWQGTFAEYLDIVRANPKVARTAYQRLYDMIMTDGSYSVEGRKDQVRYRFFDDPHNDGHDAIFGLTRPLMELVNVFKSAAMKYGTERRVLLLHGPVGSSKSTIARLLKRGAERYSRTEEGALYTFGWKEDDGSITWDPMNSEPLQLFPKDQRAKVVTALNEGRTDDGYPIEIEGDV
ncbi:MAG: serine protein kinase, partial [Planctomycetaceae bacterium]|nr:serine protein kinase [Planctomycetaceae bacterium]